MAIATYKRRRTPVMAWVLLAAWVAVIWGHSLMTGEASSAESGFVTNIVRKALGALYLSKNPFIHQLVGEHPGIIDIMTDPARFSFYVRKAAHFTEYFILGLLSFNAARKTFRSPLAMLAVVGAIWVAVPNIDEYIQSFTPGRCGISTDVMIDMSGFGLAILLCLPFVAIWMLGRAMRGPRRPAAA